MAADDSTAGKLSAEVLQAYARTPDPRLRELLSALIKHLHAFATETGLTPQEWMAGARVPDRRRAEMRSAAPGVHPALGCPRPVVSWSRPSTPLTARRSRPCSGRSTCRARRTGRRVSRSAVPEDGEPTLIRGLVTDAARRPLAGATLDVWQGNSNGLYDIQDAGQPDVQPARHLHDRARRQILVPHDPAGQLPRSDRWPGRGYLPRVRPPQLARRTRARDRLGARP